MSDTLNPITPAGGSQSPSGTRRGSTPIVVAVLALVVAAVAIVLHFALPAGTGAADTRAKALDTRISALEAKAAGPQLKIGYLDTESAFTVFTDVVKDLRQKAQDKANEIVALQQQFSAGAITKQDYDTKNNQYQSELLQAQLTIDLGTIDKMIAAAAFSDIKPQLQQIRVNAQPLVDQMKNLVSTARVGVVNVQEFQSNYSALSSSFSQLDQLLTQAALVKVASATQKVALQNGFDLVLQKKNIVIYQNTARVTDITDLVKRELATYL